MKDSGGGLNLWGDREQLGFWRHTITLIHCTRFRHYCRPISGEFFYLGEFSPLLGRNWQHLKQ